MKTPNTKFINFRQIGFEFRRIDKNNSPISTAALIINQSLNNHSILLEDIIKTNEYQNLLKVSVIFYRRFGSDPVVHFNDLISLVNWTSGNHLGEYVFLQIILGLPDTQITSEQIQFVCQTFPTLFEPIFISRIYTDPSLLFANNCPKLPLDQPVSADYLVKCGGQDYLIEKFLKLTFNSSLDFLKQACHSRCYQALLGLLNLRPDFFIAIENICRNDLFEVITQIMNSGTTIFLNIFFSYYKKIPESIIQCVNNNLSAMAINQYAKNIGKQNYRNLFNYIFENELSSLICNGLTYNDCFVPCVNELYQKSPDLVLNIFKSTDNQLLNDTIESYLVSSSNNFFDLPYPLIDAVLSKPDFALYFQNNHPQFFVSILNRYPSFAIVITEIINRKQTILYSEEGNFAPQQIILSEKNASKPEMAKNKSYPKKNNFYFDEQNEEMMQKCDNQGSAPNEPVKMQNGFENVSNSKKLLKLIYEIDENAFCGCFSSSSHSIINLLLNFVPRKRIIILQDQKKDDQESPNKDINNNDNDNDNDNDNSKHHKKKRRRSSLKNKSSKSVENKEEEKHNESSEKALPERATIKNLIEFVLNPHHLHFPSSEFFILCQNRNLISSEDLNSFFTEYLDFIVNDSEWMKIIPKVPLLFYTFTFVLFKHAELKKHYVPITLTFATNMYSTFRSNRDRFTEFTEFLLAYQTEVNIDDFPLFMKIKIATLLALYMDNVSGPLVSLFILLAKDYRSFISLDFVSKDIILNVYILGNLDHPNCHRAFIMAYEDHDSLIQPNIYIESIMKNKDAIAMTLSDDEIYFERWYAWVIKGLTSPVYQTAQVVTRRQTNNNIGNTPIFMFFRSVLLSALNYTKFQNDLEFLSILCKFLDPQSDIYNIRNPAEVEQNSENAPGAELSLKIPKNILKVVLKNKINRNNQDEITEYYKFIYTIFLSNYSSEIFKAIPIPSSLIRDAPNLEHS